MLDIFIHKWLRVPYTLHVTRVNRSKSKRTIVLLHGIGNSGEAWNNVRDKLESDYDIVTVDLLGFGSSPSPSWGTYDARTQARSVAATLLSLGIVRPVIIVGHSLGSLVAVEIAKTYRMRVKALVLASPPFYVPEDHPQGILPNSDAVLRALYRSIHKRPDQFVWLSHFAIKRKLVGRAFNVTRENVASYMAALESMIINQTSYHDVAQLKLPVHILRGTIDPFVLSKNIRALKRHNHHIRTYNVIAGHEVRAAYVPALLKVINASVHQHQNNV